MNPSVMQGQVIAGAELENNEIVFFVKNTLVLNCVISVSES